MGCPSETPRARSPPSALDMLDILSWPLKNPIQTLAGSDHQVLGECHVLSLLLVVYIYVWFRPTEHIDCLDYVLFVSSLS